MNVLNAIRIFRHPELQLWCFNDKDKGLENEALVGGTDSLIEYVTAKYGIENPHLGFLCLFSSFKFPGSQVKLTLVETGVNGSTYLYTDEQVTAENWLCPALFSYFPEAPKELHVMVRNLD